MTQSVASSGQSDVVRRSPRRLVIVPAYNEADSITQVIGDLRRCVPDCDIVVIDDGSTDGTADAARAASNHCSHAAPEERGTSNEGAGKADTPGKTDRPHPSPLPEGEGEKGRLAVISLPFNQGIGGAMQTGYRYAAMHGYDAAVQVDGDGQHPASEVMHVVQRLERGDVNMVVGSRFVEGRGERGKRRGAKGKGRGERGEGRGARGQGAEIGVQPISNPQSPIPNAYRPPASRMIGIYLLRALLRMLIGQRITDCTSGLRAVDRSLIGAFARWYPDDYPEPEVLVLLHRAGYRVAETPVRMNPRAAGRTSIPFLHGLFYVLKVSFALALDMFREPWPKTETTDCADCTD